jgi:cullin-associated NEDD8-dissociated protein 1
MVISAVHHKLNLIEPLLGDLFPLIYRATIVDEKHIHYVEMGPFKHKVDNGLEARKVIL